MLQTLINYSVQSMGLIPLLAFIFLLGLTIIIERYVFFARAVRAGSMIELGNAPASWLKVGPAGAGGMGGETAAHLRQPRSKSEQKAYADWQKLQKSNKSYGGKFEGERDDFG